MIKKSADEISRYYQRGNVVDGYDDRRFRGTGGKYINTQEIDAIIDLLKPVLLVKKKVLDMGAGRGRLTQPLTRLKATVFCLERSKAMNQCLKKIVPRSRILQQSVFDKLPAKSSFDVITSLRFFEHFDLSDQEKILKNVKKSLVKGGYLAHASVNAGSAEGLIALFFPYARYNYFYDEQTYSRLFRRHKLKIIGKQTKFFFPRGAFLHLKNPFLVKLLIRCDQKLSSWWPSACSYQVYLLKKI